MTSNIMAPRYILLSAGLSVGLAACGDVTVGGGGSADGDTTLHQASTTDELEPTTGLPDPLSSDASGSMGLEGSGAVDESTSEGTTTAGSDTEDTGVTGTESTDAVEPSPVCGDGVVDGAEQCDDGNTQGGDGCSDECRLESCGNGFVDLNEACDDSANEDPDDGCTAACQFPACGDGLIQASLGETCDLGPANADAGPCTSSCAAAVCGDGLVFADNEACDDGNAVADDGCTLDCELPSCGDGLVQPGELCDPGVMDEGTSCAVTCKAKCLYLQPGPGAGKDTRAWSRPDMVDANVPDWVEFTAMAWTWDGVPGVHRSFVEFDLSEIPASAHITSALLKLSGIGEHSSLSHSNASVLRRVVEPWQENGVSWNSQPATTSLHEVTLAKSVSVDQDYQVSVLQLVEDAVLDPAHAHGFMLGLKDESYYAAMRFASSDHPDAAKRPWLQVCYRVD